MMEADGLRQSTNGAQSANHGEPIRDEFLPFLEAYENALRNGEQQSPAQWLQDHEGIPSELRASLSELYWLYRTEQKETPSSPISSLPTSFPFSAQDPATDLVSLSSALGDFRLI